MYQGPVALIRGGRAVLVEDWLIPMFERGLRPTQAECRAVRSQPLWLIAPTMSRQ